MYWIKNNKIKKKNEKKNEENYTKTLTIFFFFFVTIMWEGYFIQRLYKIQLPYLRILDLKSFMFHQ